MTESEKEDGLTLASKAPAKLAVSASLQDADARSVVYVNRKGDIRSPMRQKVLRGLAVGVIGSAPILYGLMYGVFGLLGGGLFTGYWGWRIWQGRSITYAVRLLQADRTDEALVYLLKLESRRWLPGDLRLLVANNIAHCYALRGEFEQALATLKGLRERAGKRASSSLVAQLAANLEILMLVNLERPDEARRLMQAQGDGPVGEFLEISHWGCELYLALAEGAHSLSDEELFKRARRGLELTAGGPLLGLTAWAHFVSGDTDQAQHLLGVALERWTDKNEALMPLLAAWMKEHADIVESGDEYDLLET